MKIQLIKEKINPIKIPEQCQFDRLILEGDELREKLNNYLSRFIVGTLDPDLIGANPDGFIKNMMNNRLGDFLKRYILTAALDNQTVGILIALPKNDNVMHIFSLHVLPEFRQNGVASAMLIKCINDLFDENYSSILIDVHVNNIPAYNLYKKFGFVKY